MHVRSNRNKPQQPCKTKRWEGSVFDCLKLNELQYLQILYIALVPSGAVEV